MKIVSKFLALGALLAASSSFALADQINITGYTTYDTNAGTITFCSASSCPYTSFGDTGVFAPVNNGTVNITTASLPYMTPGPYNVPLFTVSKGSVTDTFFGTSGTSSFDANNFLDIQEQGYFTFSDMPGTDLFGTLFISTQGPQNSLVSFSGTANVTPEPNSLVLLGTGLLGVVGTMKRRYA